MLSLMLLRNRFNENMANATQARKSVLWPTAS
jgi:hypothetical protein